ncbi:MAG: hypothetical protein ACM3XO_15990 [Bacteroidota bacterium]|jgi:hypothetical protein
MLSDNALVGAIIFLLMIVGANFLMYAIARGWAKGGGSARWIDGLKQGLTKPMDSQRTKSMDELRQKVEEMNKNRKKDQ